MTREHKREALRPALFAIYARADNGVIGADGTMPWHIPADLKRFKALTMGKPMIMGRKTFESLPGLLPGRAHIVLTRDQSWQAEGAKAVHSRDEALAALGDSEAAVIGGAEILAVFMPLCERLELTEIHADFPGDTVMPALGAEWAETAREDHPAMGSVPAYSFVTYERADAREMRPLSAAVGADDPQSRHEP